MIIDYTLLGNRIRYYRTKKGLSQEELAEAADISRVFMGFIERGEKIPSLETVIAMSNALDVPVNELLSGELLAGNSSEYALFNDASAEEKEMLIQMIKGMKEILHQYKISK